MSILKEGGTIKMEFKLGQKVRYKKIVRKIQTPYLEEKDFDDEEIIEKERIKMFELTKERYGFIIGKRNIAKKAEYAFEEDDPNCGGYVCHQGTEIIKVYKVAYDMAHTNFVLEEDLKDVKNIIKDVGRG
jgi:hypothetical protein